MRKICSRRLPASALNPLRGGLRLYKMRELEACELHVCASAQRKSRLSALATNFSSQIEYSALLISCDSHAVRFGKSQLPKFCRDDCSIRRRLASKQFVRR